jgi:hypothetical protein
VVAPTLVRALVTITDLVVLLGGYLDAVGRALQPSGWKRKMDTSKEYIAMCRQAVNYLPEHEWDTGDFYAGETHVCTNESFWKTTQELHHEVGHWKKVMHASDNEICWGIVDDSIDKTNYRAST